MKKPKHGIALALFVLLCTALMVSCMDLNHHHQEQERRKIELEFLKANTRPVSRKVLASGYKTSAHTRITTAGYEKKRGLLRKHHDEDYFEYDATFKYTHISLDQHPKVLDIACSTTKLFILVDKQSAKGLIQELMVGATVSLVEEQVKIVEETKVVELYRQITSRNIIERPNGIVFIELETVSLEFSDLFTNIHYVLNISPKRQSTLPSSQIRSLETIPESFDINYSNGQPTNSALTLTVSEGQISLLNTYFHAEIGISLEFKTGTRWDKVQLLDGPLSVPVYVPVSLANLKMNIYGIIDFNYVVETNLRSIELPLEKILPVVSKTSLKKIGSIDFNIATELSVKAIVNSPSGVVDWGFTTNYGASFDIGFNCGRFGCENWNKGSNTKSPTFNSNYINFVAPVVVDSAVVPRIKLSIQGIELGADFKPKMSWNTISLGGNCQKMKIDTVFGCSVVAYHSAIKVPYINVAILPAKSYDTTIFSSTPFLSFEKSNCASRSLADKPSVGIKNVPCCTLNKVSYNDVSTEVKVIISIQNSDIQGSDGIIITSNANSFNYGYGSTNYSTSVGNITIPFNHLGSIRTITISLYKSTSDSVSFAMESFRRDIDFSQLTPAISGLMTIQSKADIPNKILTQVKGGTISVLDGSLADNIWTYSTSEFPLSLRYTGIGNLTFYPVYQVGSGKPFSLLVKPSSTQRFVLEMASLPKQNVELVWSGLVFASSFSSSISYSLLSDTGAVISVRSLETMAGADLFLTGTTKIFQSRPNYIYVSMTNSLSTPVVTEIELVDMYYLSMSEDLVITYESPKDTSFLIQVNISQPWSSNGASISLVENDNKAENTLCIDQNIITSFNIDKSLFIGEVVGESVFGFGSNNHAELINRTTLYLRVDNVKKTDSKGELQFLSLTSDTITCSIYLRNVEEESPMDYADIFTLQTKNVTYLCMEIDNDQYSFNMDKISKSAISDFVKKLTSSDSTWNTAILPIFASQLESGDLFQRVQMENSKQLCIPLPILNQVDIQLSEIIFDDVDVDLFLPVPKKVNTIGTIYFAYSYISFLAAGIIAAILIGSIGGSIVLPLVTFSVIIGIVVCVCCTARKKAILQVVPN